MIPAGAINEGPPAVPRPAATVVLVREGEPWEVLMVQRPHGADFAPSAFVFPGGTLHDDDRSFPDELRAAAVRELFEEAGILLATGADDGACAEIRRLVGPHASFFEVLDDIGLVPAFDALVLFARWVTPAQVSRRYDTRFYLARMPEGQSVTPQPGEVVDWRWVSPARALSSPDLNLVYATRAILESVADATDIGTLFSRARLLKDIPIVEPRLVHTPTGWDIVRD